MSKLIQTVQAKHTGRLYQVRQDKGNTDFDVLCQVDDSYALVYVTCANSFETVDDALDWIFKDDLRSSLEIEEIKANVQ